MCEKNEKVEANEQILEQEGSLNDDVVKEEETVCDHFESASEAADDDVQPDADAAPEVDYQGEISSLQDRLLRLQADLPSINPTTRTLKRSLTRQGLIKLTARCSILVSVPTRLTTRIGDFPIR